ncbi:MAG: sigma-70 family RNA polymerase sigma factor [Planctomycetota bacterium]
MNRPTFDQNTPVDYSGAGRPILPASDRGTRFDDRVPKNQSSDRCESQQLVDRWRDGEQSAADAIYQRAESYVRGVVRFHLNRRFFIRCDEDDAVQTIFLQVFNQLANGFDEFESDVAFRRWVRAVARNRTLKLIRHQLADRRSVSRENRAADTDAFQHLVDVQAHDRGSRGSHCEMAELVDRVGKLDGESQQIVRMLQASMTQDEIAKKMSCTTRTVRRRVTRIREALQAA